MSDDKASEPEQVPSTQHPASVQVPPPLLGDPDLILEVVRDLPPQDDQVR